jgi:hypothetical protein
MYTVVPVAKITFVCVNLARAGASSAAGMGEVWIRNWCKCAKRARKLYDHTYFVSDSH